MPETAGDRSERASGNGSIMRLAPVPIRYADMFPDRPGRPDPAVHGIQPAHPRQPAVPVGLRVHGALAMRIDPRPTA